MEDPDLSKCHFVAALRFGSTKSGYAFSSYEECLKGWPLSINADLWNLGSSMRCVRMPTTLLLNPDQSFNSFGYDAENNFTDLVEDDIHREYFYFEKFTKNLYKQIPMLSDATGKRLATKTVFSESLRFFKNEILSRLNEAHKETTINNVKFVFILPPTWDNQNEEFIKDAALSAGIESEQIIVALKMNIMPLYLRHFINPIKQLLENDDELVKRLDKIMLVDIGGQRTEISILEHSFDDNSMDNAPVVVGPYGGKRIDDEFRRFLEEMWPGMTLDELKEESLEDYIELFKEFELKKCLMTITEPNKISISLPITLVELIKNSTVGMEINEWLENSPYPEVQLRRLQHLQIPSEVVEKLFQPTIDNILKLMQKVLNDEKYEDIQAIMMTGGFAKCSHLQRAVTTYCQSKVLIISRNPELAILEGGVVFGHSRSESYLLSQKMELEDQSKKEKIESTDEEFKDHYDMQDDDKLEKEENVMKEKETIHGKEFQIVDEDSENKTTIKEDITKDDDGTDDEEESEQEGSGISLYELMKETEEEEKQQQQKEGKVEPVVTKTFEQQVIQAQKIFKVKPKEVKEIQDKIKQKYNYDKQGETEVTDKLLEEGIGINQKDKLSFNEVDEEMFELDNKEINDMVLAAKQGNWNFVWGKLDKKPYLVNCIPEQRAWSVLHQAIFHGGLEAVRRLVENYEADITICTKPDKAHAADPGTDALTLAKGLERKVIYDYLAKYTVKKKDAVKGQDISYFRLNKKGSVYPFRNYPLLQLTLASYKSLISPDHSLQADKSKHLVHLLHDVLINSAKNWEDAKLKICNTLYAVNREQSEDLKKATDMDEFYRSIIKVYTAESNVYHSLTPALVKQPLSPYKPLANDLAVGPFAIMLSAILFEWDKLTPFKGTTYRGVNVDVTSKYKVGQTFLFLHFISTSKNLSVAKHFQNLHGNRGTLFTFDNKENTQWGPREIEKFSNFPGESECLHPFGAEFEVVSVNEKMREVNLKLLSPSI